MGFETLNEGQFFRKNRVAVPGRTVSFLPNEKLLPEPQLKNGELPQFPQEIVLTDGVYLTFANVVATNIFYKNSSWDTVSDDNAIAPDKSALSPCQTGAFINVISYDEGINGIMVDVDGLGPVTVAASDFSFKVGNDNNPLGWTDAPAPESISVRRGEGAGGSDRIVISWADDSITNTWLEVRVLATGNIPVRSDCIFYYGSLVGETDGDLIVTDSNRAGPPSDVDDIRDNTTGFSAAAIDNLYDINRNKTVDAQDVIIARSNEDASINAIRPCIVVATKIFYNNSSWDTVSDDDAIATNKSALFSGGTGAFVNVTSYTKGINGIMIDVSNLTAEPEASDFSFKIGNDNNPAGWSNAPVPASISTVAGGGVGGTCRIIITWADASITNTWLEVKALASGGFGLSEDYTFYFGNLIGETGNLADPLEVTDEDETDTQSNVTGPGGASLSSRYDHNRDKTVASADIIASRDNEGTSINAIQP